MIEIDGKEGGGQIVRTAVAMSALTGKAVKVTNIRGARPKPGLKTQHMQGIDAVGKLCGAEIKGLELGSKEIEFVPKKLIEKDLEVRVSTAGATGLILQTLMICTPRLKKTIKIIIDGGGTWNKWAPSPHYLQKVLFPLLGEKSEIRILREAFYPKGGSKVVVRARPLKLKELGIIERGKVKAIRGLSVAAEMLKKRKVAERQAEAALKYLKDKVKVKPAIDIKYAEAYGAGSGVLLWAQCERSVLGGDAIGERGKLAEVVGKEAAKNLVWELKRGAVDRHAGDMLVVYMALLGKGKIKPSQITQHVRTNIEVIEKFLPVKFKIDKEKRIIEVKKLT